MQEENKFTNEEETVEAEGIAEKISKKSFKQELLEWVVSILIACILAFVIRQFVFTVVKVEGASMEPTLQNANRLIVWRFAYEPDRGDIIVLHQKNHLPYIKRVIATEGQTVDIDFESHKVYVDGVEQAEPFISQPTVLQGDVKFPVTVPDDCVFVLGDNRNNSRDSRFSDVGMVAEEDVLGKAVLRFFPLSSFGILK